MDRIVVLVLPIGSIFPMPASTVVMVGLLTIAFMAIEAYMLSLGS